MKFFKNILTLLIFLTNKIAVTAFPIYYSTGVSGTISCSINPSPIGGAIILISEKPKIQLESKPIAEEFVKYGSRFFLPGYLKLYKTWRKPNLYVKIIHNCFKSRIAAKKVFLKPIPKEFIYRGYRIVQFFDLRNLDLADLNSRLLLDKRRNTLKW